jgi:hypothetical protein
VSQADDTDRLPAPAEIPCRFDQPQRIPHAGVIGSGGADSKAGRGPSYFVQSPTRFPEYFIVIAPCAVAMFMRPV